MLRFRIVRCIYITLYTIAQVYASRRCTGIVGERRTISSTRNIMMSRTRFCSSECEQVVCCRDRKKTRCLSTMLLCPLALSIFTTAVPLRAVESPRRLRLEKTIDSTCHATLRVYITQTQIRMHQTSFRLGILKSSSLPPQASTKIDPGCCRAETRTKSPAFSGCASLRRTCTIL